MSLGTGRQIRIELVRDPERLADVFRLRYRIYVEEMHRKQKYCDHERKLIADPLDAGGHTFAAYHGDTLVGAVRVNLARSSALGSYETLYRMDAVAGLDHPQRTAICTRLMVLPELRRTVLAARLAAACFEFGVANDVAFCFLDCNDHLVRFFRGLGFREYVGKVHHDEYGWVTPMYLDLRHREQLAAGRSPLIWRRRDETPQASVISSRQSVHDAEIDVR